MKIQISDKEVLVLKHAAGRYTLRLDGDVIGHVYDRKDDWYGEVVINGCYINLCEDTKIDTLTMLDSRYMYRRDYCNGRGKEQNASNVAALKRTLEKEYFNQQVQS